MRLPTVLIPFLAACCLALAACGDPEPLTIPGPDSSGGGSGGSVGSGGSGGVGSGGAGGAGGVGGAGGLGGAGGTASESCTATLSWLQKDAYRSTAGRTSDLWPPHTTTTLTVSCDGVEVTSTFRENHGTEPSALDANGDLFLVEQGSLTVPGTREQLAFLSEMYGSCECTTSFLSMDALGDAAVQQLVGEVSGYVASHLTCTGPIDAAALVQLLQDGQIEAVIAVLPLCSWEGGTGWAGGLDAALLTIIAAGNETLADYHVCNNDAALQTGLVEAFAADGSLGACDGNLPLCHGPLWFYAPEP